MWNIPDINPYQNENEKTGGFTQTDSTHIIYDAVKHSVTKMYIQKTAK